MKSKILSLVTLTMTCFTLAACNGGSSSSSSSLNVGGSGNAGFSHSELAEIFVEDLNDDLGLTGPIGEPLAYTVAKANTQQRDYMVIYNEYLDVYNAIYIGDYNPYGFLSAEDYYVTLTRPDTDLSISSYSRNTFYSYKTGLTYEKVEATPKDLVKVKALSEYIQLKNMSEAYSSQFGLSLERSMEIARLTKVWSKSSKKSLTDEEVDEFTAELLGFSLTEGINAVKSGSKEDIQSLVDKAALKNGITPEHAEKVMIKMFGL